VRKGLQFAAASISFLLIFAILAAAQPRYDAYFGMGTARDKSSQNYVDLLDAGTSSISPALNGTFGKFGGAVMLKPSLGFGAEVLLRFRQGDYAGAGYRPVFYDFNGIWTPSLGKYIMPEFQGGIGGLHMRFYDPTFPYYDYYTGQYTTYVGSSNHLQFHASAGLRIYIQPQVFLRPQVDYYWVRNNYWFKENGIPAYTLSIGYSFRGR
jgi:hypothetical protein